MPKTSVDVGDERRWSRSGPDRKKIKIKKHQDNKCELLTYGGETLGFNHRA